MAENGFKEAEIGLMPDDWDVKILGDIADISSGGSAPQGDKYFNGVHPFVRVQHIEQFSDSINRYDLITDEAVKKYKLKKYKSGTIVFPKSGASIYLEKRAILPVDAYIVSHLCAVKSVKDNVDQEFLFYSLKQIPLSKEKADGYPTLNLSEVKRVTILLPSFEEQRKAVSVLSKIKQAITQQEKIIAKTKELKRSLMHRLFTYGLRGEELKETEIGLMPKSWEPMSISDISDKLIGGGTPSTKIPQYWKGNIEWTTSKRLGENIYLYDGEKKISENGLNNSSTNLIPKDNLLISTRVTVGKAVVNKADIAISQDLTGMIINKDRYSSEFIVYQFKIGRIQKIFDEQKRGATIKGITRGDLKKIKLGIPDIKEQKEITNMLSNVDKKIQQAETRMQGFQALFKSMLQLLMTGQVRVKDLDFGEDCG
jgi:type I restriction enzyme S subunit